MSAACFVVLEKEIPGFDPFVNGKAIPLFAGELDAECEDLGVRPLISFFSMEPEELAGFLVSEGLDELAPLAKEEWFDPKEGIRTLEALIAAAPSIPALAGRAEPVLEDLGDILGILRRALEEGVRFHLQYDY